MPLTGSESVLSAAIEAALLAEPDAGAVPGDELTALCNAIAAALIPHLIANTVVTTAGTAAAQTGTIS